MKAKSGSPEESRFDSLAKQFLGDVIEYAPEKLTLAAAKLLAEDMTYMVLHGLDYNGMKTRFNE